MGSMMGPPRRQHSIHRIGALREPGAQLLGVERPARIGFEGGGSGDHFVAQPCFLDPLGRLAGVAKSAGEDSALVQVGIAGRLCPGAHLVCDPVSLGRIVVHVSISRAIRSLSS